MQASALLAAGGVAGEARGLCVAVARRRRGVAQVLERLSKGMRLTAAPGGAGEGGGEGLVSGQAVRGAATRSAAARAATPEEHGAARHALRLAAAPALLVCAGWRAADQQAGQRPAAAACALRVCKGWRWVRASAPSTAHRPLRARHVAPRCAPGCAQEHAFSLSGGAPCVPTLSSGAATCGLSHAQRTCQRWYVRALQALMQPRVWTETTVGETRFQGLHGLQQVAATATAAVMALDVKREVVRKGWARRGAGHGGQRGEQDATRERFQKVRLAHAQPPDRCAAKRRPCAHGNSTGKT